MKVFFMVIKSEPPCINLMVVGSTICNNAVVAHVCEKTTMQSCYKIEKFLRSQV